jgi:hypothetical protein
LVGKQPHQQAASSAVVLATRLTHLWYGFAPSNAGRKEWCMLMVRAQFLEQKSSLKICMYLQHTIVQDEYI